MFAAQTIYSIGSDITYLFSPWFPRGGDYGKFMVQVPVMSSDSSSLVLTIQLHHKNMKDAGNGTAVGPYATILGSYLPGLHAFYFDVTDGIKELARYKYSFAKVGGSGTSWATFQMLSPVWYNKI